jgi:sortase A
MTARTALVPLLAGLLAGCLAACAEVEPPPASAAQPSSPAPASPGSPSSAAPSPTTTPRAAPRRSFLSIPAIEVRDVPVVSYRGTPDDALGTRIQNRGPAASPRGPGGGVGPGEVGNFLVTGHRTSHNAPFRDLPAVRRGDHLLVRQAGTVYDYVVTGTLRISFRSVASKARQSAPVPGHPGAPAVRPMITLSTCATPEDHAAGNYWADEFDNPEHRIDKVGVLVEVRPA